MNFNITSFLEKLSHPGLKLNSKLKFISECAKYSGKRMNEITHPVFENSILHYISDVDLLKNVLRRQISSLTTWHGFFDKQGLNPLVKVANDLEMIKIYIHNGFKLNQADIIRNRSILFFSSNREVINIAIRMGEDINQRDNQGITPLQDALNNQNYKKALLLLKISEELDIDLLVTPDTQVTIYDLILNHVGNNMSDVPEELRSLTEMLCFNNYKFYPQIFYRFIELSKHNRFENLHHANLILLYYYFSSQSKNRNQAISIIRQVSPFCDEYLGLFSEKFTKHIFNSEIILEMVKEKNLPLIFKKLISESIKINCIDTFRKLINKVGINQTRDI